MKNKNGFTLIEIMITLVIIGILACIVIPSYNSFVFNAEAQNAQNNLLIMKELQNNYYFSNGHYCLNAGINPSCANNLSNINQNLNSNITDNNYSYYCQLNTSIHAYCCNATGNTSSQLPVTQECVSIYQNVNVDICKNLSCDGGGCTQVCTDGCDNDVCNGGKCNQTGVKGCKMICNGGDCIQSGQATFVCNGRSCAYTP